MQVIHLKSTWGTFIGYYQEELLIRIKLPQLVQVPIEPLIFAHSDQIKFRATLESWFRDKDISPSTFQLIGSVYQKKCWDCISGIPKGSTCTYSALAKNIGHPKAARAVAQACAKNPLPLLVPCHRVVGIKGLGGYAFGKIWKEILLMREKSIPS